MGGMNDLLAKKFYKKKKGKHKRWQKKRDPICGQYTNAFKLIAK
jgi:hypothetical protein